MSKHTPGPWTVSELNAINEVSKYHIFIEPCVAMIERKVEGQDQNDMADAALIAAAPDLLNLAKQQEYLINLLYTHGINHQQTMAQEDVVRKLAGVIAKATGATLG